MAHPVRPHSYIKVRTAFLFPDLFSNKNGSLESFHPSSNWFENVLTFSISSFPWQMDNFYTGEYLFSIF